MCIQLHVHVDLVSALRGVLDEISSDVERFLTLLEQNVDCESYTPTSQHFITSTYNVPAVCVSKLTP